MVYTTYQIHIRGHITFEVNSPKALEDELRRFLRPSTGMGTQDSFHVGGDMVTFDITRPFTRPMESSGTLLFAEKEFEEFRDWLRWNNRFINFDETWIGWDIVTPIREFCILNADELAPRLPPEGGA